MILLCLIQLSFPAMSDGGESFDLQFYTYDIRKNLTSFYLNTTEIGPSHVAQLSDEDIADALTRSD